MSAIKTLLVENLYLVELIVLGLVSLALVALSISIYRNRVAGTREAGLMRDLRQTMERDVQQMNTTLKTLSELEKQAQVLCEQFDSKIEKLNTDYDRTIKKSLEYEEQAAKIMAVEQQLEKSVGSLGERFSDAQKHWDEQLSSTVDSVKQMNTILDKSLLRVDNSLRRLNEQEVLAQSFKQKIADIYEESSSEVKQHKEQTQSSQGAMVEVLDETMEESKQLLEQLRMFKNKSEEAYDHYNDELGDYESKAYQHFDTIFNEADSARRELSAGLEESRQYIAELKALAMLGEMKKDNETQSVQKH